MTERELIEGCVCENIVFQEKFYRMFCGKMLGACMRYTSSREEAEDMLQEGFVKVFDNLKHFRHDGSLEGWVKRIVVNTAISFYNKRKNKQIEQDIDGERSFEPSVNEQVSGKMDAADLLKVINMLPPGYKMVFNLFAIEGYSHKEIAETLNYTESTSKTQYHKARNLIQKLLHERKILT